MALPCVIFVANRGYALTSSRAALILHFLSKGWKVVIATADDSESRSLRKAGAYLEVVNFDRGGVSPLADMRAWRRLLEIYRKWQPVLIHQFHAKPVIFGSLAASRLTGSTCRVVNTITGLGHAFIVGGLAAQLASLGYRLALHRSMCTIFQNRDDRALFIESGWLPESQARLIIGSGVDTRRYEFIDRRGRNGKALTVVMLGRLLRQKGIPEFVEVAKRIRRRRPDIRFILAGELDPVHPDSVTDEWIRAQAEIEYHGRLTDVAPILASSDLLLFPSYREGVPRVILEAASTGLPTVGFDVPGVREVVQEAKTGFLAPNRDVDVLTDRVMELLEDENLRLSMGKFARRTVVENFDIRVIEERYLQLYKDLGLDVD